MNGLIREELHFVVCRLVVNYYYRDLLIQDQVREDDVRFNGCKVIVCLEALRLLIHVRVLVRATTQQHYSDRQLRSGLTLSEHRFSVVKRLSYFVSFIENLVILEIFYPIKKVFMPKTKERASEETGFMVSSVCCPCLRKPCR